MFINGEWVDAETFIPTILELIEEQKKQIFALSKEVEKLAEASKKDENDNTENTDMLNNVLTDRVDSVETDIDSLKAICDWLSESRFDPGIIERLTNTTSINYAEINELRTKHDRLERHAVDHWGYRF